MKLENKNQVGTVKYSKPDAKYGAGIMLEGHKNWLNFEDNAAKFCPNAGDEIEYSLSQSGKIGFVKVVGKAEVVVPKNVDVSMKEYLEETKNLWSEVSTAWSADKDMALIVFAKALAPYKYWVDNKVKEGTND